MDPLYQSVFGYGHDRIPIHSPGGEEKRHDPDTPTGRIEIDAGSKPVPASLSLIEGGDTEMWIR